MKQVIKISLCGRMFELEQDAYSELSMYLDQAKRRLVASPDQGEIIADLERSIAEKLARFSAGPAAAVRRENVISILQEVGDVETDDSERFPPNLPNLEPVPKVRRLYRIKQRQQIAGVCTGLAEYADLEVNLVRWIFIMLTLLTGGLFGLVYIAMMFIVPVADAPADVKYVAAKC